MQTKAKLQRNYVKITNIQNDVMHKFTSMLAQTFGKVVIENLDVKKMLMSHVASKGMQRASFGKFRQLLTYKMNRVNRKLIVANQHYASTQICHVCKYRKQGHDKITLQGNVRDNTKHDEYCCNNPACPKYHQIQNRDENAVMNLLILAF